MVEDNFIFIAGKSSFFSFLPKALLVLSYKNDKQLKTKYCSTEKQIENAEQDLLSNEIYDCTVEISNYLVSLLTLAEYDWEIHYQRY